MMGMIRVWLPVVIVIAGVAVIIGTGFSETGLEGGGMLVGAGLSVWLLNFMYRISVHGEHDRDAEDRAREYFDRHGRWPDDPPAT